MDQLDGINLCLPVLFLFSTGQFSCQIWRNPLCEPALVHPRSLHRDTALPQRQDQEEGKAIRYNLDDN